MEQLLLEMRGITKVYSNGIVANDNVDFSLRQGEIHALAGENGAGKSSLMKVLFGIERPDSGEIYRSGKAVHIKSPGDALDLGIGMVHQHFMLIDSLTVAENVILGHEPSKAGFLNMRDAVKLTKSVSEKYNLPIDPLEKVANLSVGMRQRVEILKTLARGVEVLILDEPTAVLTPQETARLFEELKGLRERGHSIVFISHKLHEVKELCDRITILRKGKSEGVYPVKDMTEADISRLMIGRELAANLEKAPVKRGRVILESRDLSHVNREGAADLSHVNFCVRGGEILGIAGVDGNGQDALADMISKRARPSEGEILLDGVPLSQMTVRQARENGMAIIPADRMTVGASLSETIWENLFPVRIRERQYAKGGLLRFAAIHNLCQTFIQEYRIKCQNDQQPVGMLSGGNIQKVVVARELSASPNFVLADQPTRGIDVGASEFIREKLLALRAQGCAILLISADLNEVISLSDRLLVMSGGCITAYYDSCTDIDPEELGLYMLGAKRQSPDEIGGASIG